MFIKGHKVWSCLYGELKHDTVELCVYVIVSVIILAGVVGLLSYTLHHVFRRLFSAVSIKMLFTIRTSWLLLHGW